MRDFEETDSFHRFLNLSLRYLRPRPRSETELRAYLLRRGANGEVVDQVLQKLKEQRLVDDKGFAKLWRESRQSSSPRSKFLIKRELREKGISDEIIESIVSELDDESSAINAGQKKLRSLRGLNYQNFYKKLSNFLRRRGFTYEIINQTVRQLWAEVEGEK